MSDDMDLPELRAALATSHERSACPTAELLARAASGEANATERRTVADHLVSCPSCSEEYRVAVAVGPWAREAASEPAFTPSHEPAAGWRTRTFAYAASALLALGAAAGLGGWALQLRGENARLAAAVQQRANDTQTAQDTQARTIAELRTRLDETAAPILNVPIVDLLPRDVLRGTAATVVPSVSTGAGAVTLVMTTPSDPAPRDHVLEIVDEAGAVRWRGSGLRPNAERTFTATIPGTLMPAGTSHVRLYEQRQDGPHLIADYTVVVR